MSGVIDSFNRRLVPLGLGLITLLGVIPGARLATGSDLVDKAGASKPAAGGDTAVSDPRVAAWLAKGLSAAQKGDNYSSWAWLYLAHAQAGAGDLSAAARSVAAADDGGADTFHYKDLAKGYVLVGNMPAARAMSAKIRWGVDKSKTYSEIAIAEARSGNADAARQDFASARKAALESDSLWVSWALHDLAGALAKAGNFAEADATAASINDLSRSAFAQEDIARIKARSGDFSAAEKLAAATSDPFMRGLNWKTLMKMKLDADDLPAARIYLDKITDPSAKEFACGEIAVYLARRGDIEAARSFDAKISRGSRSVESKSAIAAELVRRGRAAEAKALADPFDEPDEKASILTAIGAAQFARGDTADAKNTLRAALASAKGMTPSDESPFTYCAIGVAQFKAGDVEGAASSFAAARKDVQSATERYQPGFLKQIAQEQGEAGDFDGMALTIKTLDNNLMAADVCHDVARSRAKRGEMDGLDRWILSLPPGVCQVAGYSGTAEGLVDGNGCKK